MNNLSLWAKSSLVALFASSAAYAQSELQLNTGALFVEHNQFELYGFQATVGHQVELDENLYLIPNLRIATGIGDDGSPSEVELDQFYSVGTRIQYSIDHALYCFGSLSYGRIELKSTRNETSDDEYGIGAGIGYSLSETLGGEFSLEKFDDINFYQLSLNLTF